MHSNLCQFSEIGPRLFNFREYIEQIIDMRIYYIRMMWYDI